MLLMGRFIIISISVTFALVTLFVLHRQPPSQSTLRLSLSSPSISKPTSASTSASHATSSPAVESPFPSPISSIREQLSNGSTDQPERIAVCMTGAARTIFYPAVYENILANAIQPLKDDGYLVDIIFLLRLEDEPGPVEMAVKTNRTGVYETISKFSPVKVIEYTKIENDELGFDMRRFIPKINNDHPSIKPPKHCINNQVTEAHVFHFSHSLYRTKQCTVEISKIEKENNFQYDWIYRLRPDVVYYNKLLSPKLLSRNIFYTSPWNSKFTTAVDNFWVSKYNNHIPLNLSGIGDQFFITSRHLASVAFDAFDIINVCNAYQMTERNSESGLKLWLLLHKIQFQILPVTWDIIRGYPNSFCFFMEHVTTPNTTYAERQKTCQKFRGDNLDRLPK